uniref:Flotillin-2 n=1 Tax=Schistocephalus solidus TaxID=70667 RepID=A0A0X3NL29_SCHSO
MGNVHAVGPHEALVLSGGCCGSNKVRTVIGGWGWAWWCLTDVQRLSLSLMTLQPRCEDVETSEGVPVTVTGVAQVKVMTDVEFLSAACEQFLGRSVSDIKATILNTLEGHLRAILGTLSVESIYQDRDQFAALVREVAAPDVGRMGIEILSFTIKDLYDKVEYLDSLGRAQTANVMRDADIGVAEAERDAGIREAECNKKMMDTKFEADGSIADSKRKFELLQAEYQQEVNVALADSQLAYTLQAAKENQKIKAEDLEIEVVGRKRAIEIEEQEIIRNERKLDSTIRLPAEAEAYRVQKIAEGERARKVLEAQAAADGIRGIGNAKAAALGAKGDAEAEGLLKMGEAFAQFSDAAKLNLILQSLPSLAAEVAAPLAQTKEIVVLGGSGGNACSNLEDLGRNLTNLAGTLPPAIRALTGVDISQCISRIPGAIVA